MSARLIVKRHALAHASDAECLPAMVLDILSDRVALWRMDQRFEHIDLELLLGEGVHADWFHDNRLGRALSRTRSVRGTAWWSGLWAFSPRLG